MRVVLTLLFVLPLTADAGPRKRRALTLQDYEQSEDHRIREETMKRRLEAIRLLEELLEEAGVFLAEDADVDA